jgi:sugar/nucleoside kinase (ribokinase family)
MSILIVGSVAFDSIETPFGKVADALGGSATYFSLAAGNFTKPSVVAVVGQDFTQNHRRVLEKKNVDLSGLEQTSGQSFRWGGKYGFDLNNRETLFTHLNVFENFRPKLLPHHLDKQYVFLGNIHPALQLQVLKQIKKPKVVGLDTMNLWIKQTRDQLLEVLKLVDIFIINDAESRELTGEHNLLKAAKKILGLMQKTDSTLIIKQGEHGLMMFKQDKCFNLPGFPLEDVLDPTGAGDTFAGGFMGYLAQSDDLSWDNFKKAAVFGSAVASFCVEKMGTDRLQEISLADINARFAEFKHLTHFENI